MRKILCVLPLIAAMPVHAAEPAALYDAYFGKVQDGAPCYARSYDKDHLAKHPKQKIEVIEIDMTKENADGKPNTPDAFELGMGLKPKGGKGWYGGSGYCKTEGDGFVCFLEADGGTFTLKPEGEKGLKLTTGETGISMEGDDFFTAGGKESDDKVFVLSLSSTECKEAAAFFTKGGGQE